MSKKILLFAFKNNKMCLNLKSFSRRKKENEETKNEESNRNMSGIGNDVHVNGTGICK